MEGTHMKTGLRFTLQHIGDVFTDTVQNAADSAAALSKKVIRTCDPNSLHNRKKKLFGAIIKRESIVGTVQKAADSAVVITKNVIRTYDLNSLNSQKRKISEEIVERVSAQINGGSGGVNRDAGLSRLVIRLNGIEKKLAGYKKQETRLVGPVTSVLTKLGKALFSAKKEK